MNDTEIKHGRSRASMAEETMAKIHEGYQRDLAQAMDEIALLRAQLNERIDASCLAHELLSARAHEHNIDTAALESRIAALRENLAKAEARISVLAEECMAWRNADDWMLWDIGEPNDFAAATLEFVKAQRRLSAALAATGTLTEKEGTP